MKQLTKHVLLTTIVLGTVAAGAAAAFVWAGAYNIGADSPHWSVTHTMIETLRDRSIQSRLDGIKVPNLDDPARIRLGAASYSAMCTGCHLSPGVEDTEIRPGLYPMPPNLTTEPLDSPETTFWVIKHGIKMTAMPAWGKTHTDEQIWNMVAFVHKLRGMTPAQYVQLGGKLPAEDDDHMHEGMDHHHAGADEHMHEGSDHHHAGADDHHAADAAHDEPAAAEGDMHMHADGTMEHHHPATATEPHKDDDHTH